VNTSSSPAAEAELVSVPIGQLHQHPLNANEMSEARLKKLARNIERERRYPPLVARPHPEISGEWQLLDGHQRFEVLNRLGFKEVLVFPWPCDDQTALLLLSTLNRLEGEDVPSRRGELLSELADLLPADELTLLLPESEAAIAETIALVDLHVDAVLAELGRAAESGRSETRGITFAVTPEDEATIERVVKLVADGLDGHKRRGRALALICDAYLGASADA